MGGFNTPDSMVKDKLAKCSHKMNCTEPSYSEMAVLNSCSGIKRRHETSRLAMANTLSRNR